MSNTSKIILVTIIATCILLGLGYAAITNITLNIAGIASATADSGNFKVRFTDNIAVSESAYVTATRTGDHTATIAVNGLTSAGQEVTATYEIKNESSDLSADLKVDTSNDNTEYFKISSQLADSSLTASETTTVLVTVELTKTPIDEDVSANVGVELTAMPVQPGEEGTSVGTNDYSETPTTVNEYGFYFEEAYKYTDESGIESMIIFHEDRSAEMLINGVLDMYAPVGEVEYADRQVIYGNLSVNFSDDGTQLIWGESKYTLDESYMNRVDLLAKNEYGFYYGQPYSVNVYGESFGLETYIFNEDGSAEYYIDGVIEGYGTKYTLVYEKNKIIFTLEGTYEDENGEIVDDSVTVEIDVLADGRILDRNGSCFGLDLTFLEKYCLPEGYYYGVPVDELENGDLIYAWLKQIPEKINFFDFYLTPEYGYLYGVEEWVVGLPQFGYDVPSGYVAIGKDKELYGEIPSEILGYPTYSISSLFENCTNLKTAPAVPSSIKYMDRAFAGCTSLEGEIEINVVNLESYDNCFDGVDMSKITLTGTASKEIKNLLGSTGENYTPIE